MKATKVVLSVSMRVVLQRLFATVVIAAASACCLFSLLVAGVLIYGLHSKVDGEPVWRFTWNVPSQAAVARVN